MVDPRMGHSNLVIREYTIRGARGDCMCPSMVDPWMDVLDT